MAKASRGKLVVFEGLDRAGKSTQCAKLVENLRSKGRTVKALRFPDRTTPIGKMISSYLGGDSQQEDHVIHLLFSANRWELAYDHLNFVHELALNDVSAEIEHSLSQGTDVVIDRYYYSGCVYSAAKNNPSLGLAWARKPDEGLPRPDICVFLSISTEDAAKRGGFGQERYEQSDMQRRVQELFAVLRNLPDGEDFVEIDGGATLEAVEAKVLDVVETRFREVDAQQLPLRYAKPW